MCSARILLCALFWIVSGGEEVLYGHEDPSANIVHNWDMEDPFTSDDWTTGGAQVTRTQDEANTGNYSAYVHGRSSKFGGLYQKIYFGSANPLLVPNHSYYLSTFIKLANNASGGYVRVRFMYRVVFANRSQTYQGPIARLHFQFADGDWNQMGGDIFIPRPGLPTPIYVQMFLEVKPTNINYYLDTFALTRITELGSNWKSTLQAKIERVRRRRAALVFVIPSNITPSSTRIVVNMTRPLFNWGPALADWHLNGDSTLQRNLKAYMKRFFSWATFSNSMKWLRMESSKGHIQFHPVAESLQWLVDNNFRVRGHTILWEIMEANPGWLHNVYGQQMVNEMWRRINYTMSFWKNDVYEWDICNEYLNNHFYEDRSGIRDLNLLVDVFEYAHTRDSAAKLCINEYRVLRDGQLTSAEANLAKKLLNKQAPVSCLAAQSHLRLGDAYDYNIDRYLKRLQIISAPDLPITISEFTVQVTNVTNRAAILEKLLYAIYSEPKVEGVIFWSISNLRQLAFEGDSNFVEGINFQPNEAGQVLEYLLGTKWRTVLKYRPSKRRQRYIDYMYHGQYTATLYVDNIVHRTINFTVNPAKGIYRKTLAF